MIMTPTREQFKELMTFIKNAQEKEGKVNDALRIIWDDEQEQYPPFYISPWWIAIRYAFEAPKGEAKYWIDEKEYNVSDIDAFYDYLVEISNESR